MLNAIMVILYLFFAITSVEYLVKPENRQIKEKMSTYSSFLQLV